MFNKRFFCFLFLGFVLLAGFPVKNIQAASAPGVYITPDYTDYPADITSIDWSAVQTAPYTYWAVHNWNAGEEGGGYAGFQQRGPLDPLGVRTLHFAMWDPIASNQAIKAEYLSPLSIASSFGGEGTGLKIETPYAWKNERWYRMVMRSWQEEGHSKFGQWVRDEDSKQWELVGIMDFPVAGVTFKKGHMAFQEDWYGNREEAREARLKKGYSRVVGDQWLSWDSLEVRGQNPLDNNWDGGATSDYVWFKAGGNSISSIGLGKSFDLTQPQQPEKGSFNFTIDKAQYKDHTLNVSWKLKEQSTPQFKGTIEIWNERTGRLIQMIENIKSYQNEVNFPIDLTEDVWVKVKLVDLFDQSFEKGTLVSVSS